MKQFECKSINDILETRKVDRTAKYKMVKASDEEMEELKKLKKLKELKKLKKFKDFFNTRKPFYFIEKVLD